MAVAKLITGNDIIYGLSVVGGGTKQAVPEKYSPVDRVIDLPQPSGFFYQELATRYLYHGGPGGSGNWEH